MIRGVGGAPSAVYLQQQGGMEEAPGWLQVLPPLKGVARQAGRLEAEARYGQERAGQIERVSGGAVPGAGNGAPDALEDGGAAVVFVNGCLLCGLGSREAAGALGVVACALDGAFKVSVMDGDGEVVCFLLGYCWMRDAFCDGRDAPHPLLTSTGGMLPVPRPAHHRVVRA